MKEMNIHLQKNMFSSSGEKARWWLEGCGQGRWKVVDSGLPSSTRQGAAAQESWSGIGPSGRREGGWGENLEETGCPRKNTYLTRKLSRRAGLGSNKELYFQLLAAQTIIVSLVLKTDKELTKSLY